MVDSVFVNKMITESISHEIYHGPLPHPKTVVISPLAKLLVECNHWIVATPTPPWYWVLPLLTT